MFLNQLEIFGFKSFPARLELKFGDGVTGIVGPNGCGKTNIVDAIRWVLGEQKPTLLRSEHMEDVIFNGTTQRKPLGMAEVSLTIDNTRGVLAPEFSEVMITRRLFRSGESEYLLNKTPCRRKDIVEMFLDTGMASHAYSVIELPMVESILGGQTEALRVLFEEAAGIAKYKARRREASRKLARTKENLLRVGDILEEVEKQVRGLRRQAAKAERYQRYSQELRNLELAVAGKEYRRREEEVKGIRKLLADAREEADRARDELSAKESRGEQLRQQLTQQESSLSALRAQLAERGEEIHKLEEQKLVSNERKQGLQDRLGRIQTEIEMLGTKLEAQQRQREERVQQATAAAEELSAAEKAFARKEEALTTLEDGFFQKRAAMESVRRQVSDLLQRRNDLRGDADRLGAHQDTTQLRRRSLTEELERATDQLDQVAARLLAADDTLSEAKENQEESDARLQKAMESRDRQTASLEKAIQKQRELESQVEIHRNKVELLRSVLESYEGYKQGVKSLLTNLSDLPGVLGTVADMLQTEGSYAHAIEAALGEAAQYIIVQNSDAAYRAIEHLRVQRSGRATFLILDQVQRLDPVNRPEPAFSMKGAVAWAPEVVSCDDRYQSVVHFLLGDVVIVEQLPPATADNHGDMPKAISYVALSGDLLRIPAVLRGGHPSKRMGLLDRRRIIVQEEQKLSTLNNSLKKARAQRQQLEADGKQQAEKSDALRQNHEAQKVTRMELEKEAETLRLQSQALQERKAALNKELKELGNGGGSNATQLNQLTKRLSELEKDMTAKQDALARQEEELHEMEPQSRAAAKEVNEARVQLVSLAGHCEQLRLDSDRLQQIESDLLSNLEARRAEITDIGTKSEELAAQVAEMGQEIQERSASKAELETHEKHLVEEEASMRETLRQIEIQTRIDREARETTQSRIHEHQLQLAEIEAKQQAAAERIKEEYQIDLQQVRVSREGEGDQLSLEEKEKRIGFLRERIRIMGPVNIAALEEYNTQNERFDFLSTQRDDLLRAEENLNQVIGDLNKRARRLFTATFKKVNQNFQTIFTQMFDGGEADLILSGKGDPLEADIEIYACPGGKKLRHIAQLSGGEKALTAISLLFSLYQVKPSPFCVLDEVDAPLDDANINRFLSLLRSLSEKSQFIIITHNKNTMAAADVLYGVTMEQSGVSKVVSVNLRQAEKTVAA